MLVLPQALSTSDALYAVSKFILGVMLFVTLATQFCDENYVWRFPPHELSIPYMRPSHDLFSLSQICPAHAFPVDAYL